MAFISYSVISQCIGKYYLTSNRHKIVGTNKQLLNHLKPKSNNRKG